MIQQTARLSRKRIPSSARLWPVVIIALAALNGLSPIYHLVGAVSDNPHYALSGGAVGVTVLANLLVVGLIWVLESGHVDFLKDAAFIKVSYTLEKGQAAPSIDQLTRARDYVES